MHTIVAKVGVTFIFNVTCFMKYMMSSFKAFLGMLLRIVRE